MVTFFDFKMNENWRFGKKARLKLCAPRKKRNLANLKRKKPEDHKNNEEVSNYNILNILFVLINR